MESGLVDPSRSASDTSLLSTRWRTQSRRCRSASVRLALPPFLCVGRHSLACHLSRGDVQSVIDVGEGDRQNQRGEGPLIVISGNTTAHEGHHGYAEQ